MVSSNPHTSKIEYGCQLILQERNRWHLERRTLNPTVSLPPPVSFQAAVKGEVKQESDSQKLPLEENREEGYLLKIGFLLCLCGPDSPNAFQTLRVRQKVPYEARERGYFYSQLSPQNTKPIA